MPPIWLVIVLSCLFGIPTVLVVVPILLAIIVSHWSDIENVVKKLAGKLVTLLRSGANTLLSHLSDIVAYPVCILLGCAPGYVARLRRKRWEDKVAKSLRRSSADVEENRETRPELILDVWVPEAALRSRETTANGPAAQAIPPVNGITPEAALQMHHTPVQGPNSQASSPVNAIPPETAHRPQESPAGAPIPQVRPPVNELPLVHIPPPRRLLDELPPEYQPPNFWEALPSYEEAIGMPQAIGAATQPRWISLN